MVEQELSLGDKLPWAYFGRLQPIKYEEECYYLKRWQGDEFPYRKFEEKYYHPVLNDVGHSVSDSCVKILFSSFNSPISQISFLYLTQ